MTSRAIDAAMSGRPTITAQNHVSAHVQRAVLIALTYYEDTHTPGEDWRSVDEIAAATDLTSGAVRRALAGLRAQGLIEPVGGVSRGRVPTRYRTLPNDVAPTDETGVGDVV